MRARLIAAATSLVTARGFARLRLADVAEEAGASMGALLHHFPAKNDLIVALFDHLYGSMADASTARRVATATLGDVVRGMIDDARAFFLGESFRASLDIAIGATREEPMRGDVLAIIARYRTAVEARWIERLALFGIGEGAATDAIWVANSIFRGLAVRAIWDHDSPQFARMEQVCERMILADLTPLIR